MTPEREQFEAFLSAIDENAKVFLFRAIKRGSESEKARTRELRGGPDLFVQLAKLNQSGFGIYVVINESTGYEDKDVRCIRHLFVDLDGATIDPVRESEVAPLLVVSSNGTDRYHAYWRVTGCPLADFRSTQQALVARFGGDPACVNRARLMRVPGFINHKTGQLAQIVEDHSADPPTDYAEFLRLMALPPRPVLETTEWSTEWPTADREQTADDRETARRVAQQCAARTQRDSAVSRHGELLRVGRFMRRDGVILRGPRDPIIDEALTVFEQDMRETDTNGKRVKMCRPSAHQAVCWGYTHAEEDRIPEEWGQGLQDENQTETDTVIAQEPISDAGSGGGAFAAAGTFQAVVLAEPASAVKGRLSKHDAMDGEAGGHPENESLLELRTRAFKLAQESYQQWVRGLRDGEVLAFYGPNALSIEDLRRLKKGEDALMRNCLAAQERARQSVVQEFQQFPVPVLNELVAFFEQFANKATRQITVQGVLALISVLTGRLYISEGRNMTSLYLLYIASTGQGKDYPLKAIEAFLEQSGLSRLLGPPWYTAEGAIHTALVRQPTHIALCDECGIHLSKLRNKNDNLIGGVMGGLRKVYSSVTSSYSPVGYSMGRAADDDIRDANKKPILRPAITLLGVGTPDQVLANLRTDEIQDGTLNRFVSVIVDEAPVARRLAISPDPLPNHLAVWAKNLRCFPITADDLEGGHERSDQTPQQKRVAFTVDAQRVFSEFQDEIDCLYERGDYEVPELTTRWRENAMRMATAMAACEDRAHPSVKGTVATWCVNYVRHHGRKFMQAAACDIADTPFLAAKYDVARIIRKSGEQGITTGKIISGSRKFRSLDSAMRKRVLDTLIQEPGFSSRATANGQGTLYCFREQ